MKGLYLPIRDWLERRRTLREYHEMQSVDSDVLKFKITDELTKMLASLGSGDRGRAADMWDALIRRHPEEARGSPVAPQVLMKLGRFDEAEALIREAQRRRPRDSALMTKLAEIAQTKGDYQEAISQCVALRKHHPGVAHGYFLAASSLAALHRLEEAEALTEQAMARFPKDIRGFLEYARIGERRNDWSEALRRWRIVRDSFGGQSFGYLGCGRALRHLGRFDDAESALNEAKIRFPADSGAVVELARCAEAKGDIRSAVEHWHDRVRRFPLEAYGYCDAAAAFERLGAPAEAEATLQAAISRFPHERRPAADLARLQQRAREGPSE